MLSGRAGEGKTRLILGALEPLVASRRFGCIHLCTSQRRIIDEVRHKLPPVLGVVQEARDPALCGERNDKAWNSLYKGNLAEIGKHHICEPCPNRSRCAYFNQTGGDAPVFLQTQHYLFKNKRHVRDGDLIIFDETTFLQFPIRRTVPKSDFKAYLEVAKKLGAVKEIVEAGHELLKTGRLMRAPFIPWDNKFAFMNALFTANVYNWTPFIMESPSITVTNVSDRFLYRARPFPDSTIIVAAHGADPKLLEYYFDRPFVDLSPPIPYRDPKTRIVCLATSSTSKANFRDNPKSRNGILSFAVKKILQNRKLNKKTLLISKVDLIPLAIQEYGKHLPKGESLEIVDVRSDPREPDGLYTVPVIHYGVEGVNQFENYDCVICLNAFNIRPEDVEKRLDDLGLGPVSVKIVYDPWRKIVTDPPCELAEAVFKLLEIDTIIQAISRIRPWTKPCEIYLAGRQEFDPDIEQVIKRYSSAIKLKNGEGLSNTHKLRVRILDLHAQGIKGSEISRLLKVTRQTVSKHIKKMDMQDAR